MTRPPDTSALAAPPQRSRADVLAEAELVRARADAAAARTRARAELVRAEADAELTLAQAELVRAQDDAVQAPTPGGTVRSPRARRIERLLLAGGWGGPILQALLEFALANHVVIAHLL